MKPIVFLLFSCLFIAACGGPKAFYDYDESMNFAQCKTFSFYDNQQTGLNELDQERLFNALTSQLISKGLTPSESADFKINITTDVFQERNNNTSVGIGIGGGSGGFGGGVSGGIPINSQQTILEITIDFANSVNNELFWQAVVEDNLPRETTPEERTEIFNEMIAEALENFPPEK
ncbi:DUF4136 domain-containing protein [Mesonia sp. K7]|uniref:DUF4136 domain-containing protein n=1 Tax=Mesonia sp. K7 TaxID=2218606 RepID=UPI000DA7BB1B|nr:DUF4136 domain-containing protein [Mesonia sp. K7]PZD76991.1 DUF4136 domain-containing protein [Mesonia sp. K7]